MRVCRGDMGYWAVGMALILTASAFTGCVDADASAYGPGPRCADCLLRLRNGGRGLRILQVRVNSIAAGPQSGQRALSLRDHLLHKLLEASKRILDSVVSRSFI